MELMTTSLDNFYKCVTSKAKMIPEAVLGKIAVCVSSSKLNPAPTKRAITSSMFYLTFGGFTILRLNDEGGYHHLHYIISQ